MSCSVIMVMCVAHPLAVPHIASAARARKWVCYGVTRMVYGMQHDKRFVWLPTSWSSRTLRLLPGPEKWPYYCITNVMYDMLWHDNVDV